MGLTDEKRKISRAAAVVTLATLGSRVLGFIRDILVANMFGAAVETDAFFVAFRIPNLLRRLFAEGALTVAVIPVFTDLLRKKGLEEANYLLRSTSSMLALVLLGICLAGGIFADKLLLVIAPGFTASQETFDLAVHLTRWCLPFVFFISLAALGAGVLNSLDHFFVPAFSNALLNLSMIACALVLAPWVNPPILSLGIGVLLGGVAQFLIQLPLLRARGITLRPAWAPRNPNLRRILRAMAPAAVGVAVYQITTLVSTLLASLLSSGSVSHLYYAEHLIEFPIGLCAMGISSAILPSLSRLAADHDIPALKETVGFGLRIIFFAIMPAVTGILMLADPLITMLFLHGRFGPVDVQQTVQALLAFGVGFWAFAASRPVILAFFALQMIKPAVVLGGVCLVINIVAALALILPLKHAGLALATSITAVCNLLGSLWLLRRRLGPLGLRAILASACKCLVLSLFMALIVWLVAYVPGWGEVGGWVHRIVRPLTAILAGVLVYAGGAALWRMPELREVVAIAHRRPPGGRGREA